MKTSPWARRQARRALVQALYQWQMSGNTPTQIIAEFEGNSSLKKADRDFFHELLRGVVLAPGQQAPAPIAQFGGAATQDADPVDATNPNTTTANTPTANTTTDSPTNNKGVPASDATAIKPCAVDALFASYLDRGTHELDKVELAILRLGSYELQQRIDVPFRVVIDEYVELTKLFGAEDAHRYINGVLDKVAAQTRKPEMQQRRPTPESGTSEVQESEHE